jgi:DNA polymerase I-like protein with 3'-5' exonuclease and polymerase domains
MPRAIVRKQISHEVLQQITAMSKKYKVKTNTIITEEALDALIKKIQDIKLVAFDTETKGLSASIVGMSFAFSDTEGYYIPTGHVAKNIQLQLFTDSGSYFDNDSQLPLELVLKKLKPVFENPEICFIGWNMGYDYRVMVGNGIKMVNIEDAQVMAWLLDENKSTSLKDRAKEDRMQQSTLKMSEFCDESNIQKSSIDYVSPYAIQDACLTYQLFQLYKTKLEEIGMFEYYQSVEVPFIFVLSDMMLKGIRIDTHKIEDVKKYCVKKLEELEEQIYAEAGESFNISSGQQKAFILFEKLGLPIYKRTPAGAPSTDKKVLEELAKNGHTIATLMLEYSAYSKLVTTYMDSYRDMADSFQRIHSSFNQTGTVSGRLCVAADTLIETDKGCFEISKLDLRQNTIFNVATHKGNRKKILNLFLKGEEEMFKVTLVNGCQIKCTAAHKFLTDEGWKHLNQLSVGSSVFSYAGSCIAGSDCILYPEIILSISSIGIQEVWDIEVEDDHSYLAQGFVNHNSSSSPNLQNLPRDKRIRELFVPDKGKKFVIADYSQLELRVLTHFSQDKVMLGAFTTGEDLHTSTACKIYGKTPEAVEKQERFLAKTVNFSIVYGSGAKPELGITKEFIAKWRQAHYGAYAYIKGSHKEYERTGHSRTLMGRFRRTPDLLKTKDEGLQGRYLRELFSAHIQGSAADIVKMAMIMIHAQLREENLDADMIIQVHDEIIVECAQEHVDRVKEIMQDCMENALPLKCPLEATPNVGESWADKA